MCHILLTKVTLCYIIIINEDVTKELLTSETTDTDAKTKLLCHNTEKTFIAAMIIKLIVFLYEVLKYFGCLLFSNLDTSHYKIIKSFFSEVPVNILL